jgi:hypothetical protein
MKLDEEEELIRLFTDYIQSERELEDIKVMLAS